MKQSIKKGKVLIFAIIFSSIIFLILHNNDLYFQEYGNRILLNIFRIAIFAPLLYFLYKKHNWARYTLVTLCSILVLAGIIGYIFFLNVWMRTPDIFYFGCMMICMLFNAPVLLFSKDVKYYINSNKDDS